MNEKTLVKILELVGLALSCAGVILSVIKKAIEKKIQDKEMRDEVMKVVLDVVGENVKG